MRGTCKQNKGGQKVRRTISFIYYSSRNTLCSKSDVEMCTDDIEMHSHPLILNLHA